MDRFIKIIRTLVLFIMIVWGTAWLTWRGMTTPPRERNLIENSMVKLGEAPAEAIRYIRTDREHLEKGFGEREGLLRMGELPEEKTVAADLYLLHYRYLGKNRGEVWLQNIQNGEIAWKWNIPLEKVYEDIRSMGREFDRRYREGKFVTHFDNYMTRNIEALNIHSPVMMPDSSLYFNCILGYIYKLDKNSNLLWRSERLAHHSIEPDSAGNIWTCSVDPDNKMANRYGFRDDAILALTPDGKEHFFRSLTDIFESNALLEEAIFSTQSLKAVCGFDPYHINDVLPVGEDGIVWKKGDLMLSLRHQSMVVVYRPQNDSIVWYRKGPWLTQHDIHIHNDSVFSVFNNNAWFDGILDKGSDIAFHNIVTGESWFRYSGIFRSPSNGRQNWLADGRLLVEETDRSRYYLFDSDEKLMVQFYIPYRKNSENGQYPGWGRLYLKREQRFEIQ
ncbi:MAG: hypothetical protein Kow00127_13830 [Bacteroidales bacterium]